MVLCTHRAQGVLVTKIELWIPPSSSYVSNVTARLRENRLYAGWATLACAGGFWGSLYVLWMVYEVSKQVTSIKQHGRCIHTSAWWCHIVIWWAQFVHIVGTKHAVGWPILCFYAFPGSIIPPWGSQGTSIGFGCTEGRADEACACFVRFLSLSCLSADPQKPLATAWGGSVELPSMFIGSAV